jgi:hypothetical protein
MLFQPAYIYKLKKLFPILTASDGAHFDEGELCVSLRGKWFALLYTKTEKQEHIAIGERTEGNEWVECVELDPGFNAEAWALQQMAKRCLSKT